MGDPSTALLFRLAMVGMFIGVPALMLLFGASLMITTVRRRRAFAALNARGERASGRVLRVRRRFISLGDTSAMIRDIGDEPRFVEELVFITREGREVRGRAVGSDAGERDRTGEEVTVLYDPARPTFFASPVDGERLDASGDGVLLTMGCVFTVLPALVLGGIGWMYASYRGWM